MEPGGNLKISKDLPPLQGWGWTPFLPVSQVLIKQGGFCQNGKVLVGVHMTFKHTPENQVGWTLQGRQHLDS